MALCVVLLLKLWYNPWYWFFKLVDKKMFQNVCFAKTAHFVPLPKLPFPQETVNLLIIHVMRGCTWKSCTWTALLCDLDLAHYEQTPLVPQHIHQVRTFSCDLKIFPGNWSCGALVPLFFIALLTSCLPRGSTVEIHLIFHTSQLKPVTTNHLCFPVKWLTDIRWWRGKVIDSFILYHSPSTY